VQFKWTPKCEEIFLHLKEILTSAPILKISYLDNYFVVCIDAYKEGLGGVFTQKDLVACYESIKLKGHERNYATHDIELEAIIIEIKMWMYYLMGRKFELRKNHYGQKHLFVQPILNVRQTRWLELLSEYDFEIKHIKGK
jgi:hypothetical protein